MAFQIIIMRFLSINNCLRSFSLNQRRERERERERERGKRKKA
jgi:hypothetical protein